MNKIIILLLCLLSGMSGFAQRISESYHDVSFSDVLKKMNAMQSEYIINFVYDELEDFKVTKTIHKQRVPDAIREIIGFYPIKMTVMNGVIMVECTQKAAQKMTGRIVDTHSQPVEFANVSLLNVGDSTFITGGVTNANGDFIIPCEAKKAIVKVSCVGYQTAYNTYRTGKVGTIALTDNTVKLQKVVVKGRRPQYKLDAEGLNSTIQGTMFAELGSLTDVLDQMPFISATDDKVSVMGRGTPLFYVDGRRITDMKEIARIKSDAVKDVKVIMNPGSRYPSNVTSVIRVTTIRKQGEGLSGTVEWKGSQNEDFTQNDHMSLNYRKKEWDFFGSMSYANGKSHSRQIDDQKFTYRGTTISSYNDSKHESTSNHFRPRGGFNYSSENGKLYAGMNYSYYQGDNKFSDFSQYTATDLEGEQRFTSTGLATMSWKNHNADAYLLKKYDNKWQLDYNMSYVNSLMNRDQYDTELQDGRNAIVSSLSEQRSNMLAEKLTVSKSFGKNKIVFGEEYSYTDNKQIYNVDDDGANSLLQSKDNQSKQNSFALFTEYLRSWKSVSINAGLRYEYVSYTYEVNGERQEEQCRKYGSLMPTFSVNYNKGRFGATLSFRSTVKRPSYYELRSSMQYNNRYCYEDGNPELKSTYKYDIGLLMTYRDFVLSANHYILKDHRLFYAYQLDEAPVMVFSVANMNTTSTGIMISYAPSFGSVWKPSLSLYGNFQDVEYKGIKNNSPLLQYTFKNAISLPKKLLITFNMTGATRGSIDMTKQQPSFSSHISVRKSFAWGLQATLGLRDIFNSQREYWCMNINGITTTKWLKSGSREVYLNLRYNFNTAKSKYKGTGAGNEEKNRL